MGDFAFGHNKHPVCVCACVCVLYMVHSRGLSESLHVHARIIKNYMDVKLFVTILVSPHTQTIPVTVFVVR